MTLESEHLMGQDHLAEHTKCQLLAGAGDAARGETDVVPALMMLLRYRLSL